MEGKREETSKLAGDSRSRRSTFIVRQLIAAIMAGEEGEIVLQRTITLDSLWRGSVASIIASIMRAKCRSSGTFRPYTILLGNVDNPIFIDLSISSLSMLGFLQQ